MILSRDFRFVTGLNKLRLNSKCLYCGVKLDDENRSVEHIIPLAVFKWSGRDSEDPYFDLINKAGYNVFWSCKRCNSLKGNSVPTKHEINRLRLDDVSMKHIRYVYSRYKVDIDSYLALKSRVLHGQDDKCACCGRKLIAGVDDYSLRRIDDKSVRKVWNACVVCEECNDSFRYMRRGVLDVTVVSSNG